MQTDFILLDFSMASAPMWNTLGHSELDMHLLSNCSVLHVSAQVVVAME